MAQELEAPLDEGEGLDMTVVKIALGFVPGVGGALAEIAGHFNNNLTRRQEFWMVQVSEAINDLQKRAGLSINELMNNEAFTSFLLQATPIALRNHQQVKLEALKNALASVGNPEFSDEDLAFQFLRYIDELTVSHLVILRTISKRSDAFKSVKSMQQAFEQLMQGECAGAGLSPVIARTYLRDLDARGLVNAIDLEDLPEFESKAVYIAAEQSERHSLQLTELGGRFFAFVSVQA
jgi:hypothetical protein